jgi:hypothetical protein
MRSKKSRSAIASIRTIGARGLATEAARAVRDHGFDDLKLPRLISLIHPDNVASKRVAEKNGMLPEKETIFRGFPAIVFAISRPSFDKPGDPKVVTLGSSLSKQ